MRDVSMICHQGGWEKPSDKDCHQSFGRWQVAKFWQVAGGDHCLASACSLTTRPTPLQPSCLCPSHPLLDFPRPNLISTTQKKTGLPRKRIFFPIGNPKDFLSGCNGGKVSYPWRGWAWSSPLAEPHSTVADPAAAPQSANLYQTQGGGPALPACLLAG